MRFNAFFTGIGLTSENNALTSGCASLCIFIADCKSPSKKLWHMPCTLAGATFDHTEITPIAPIAISGTTIPSSPEYRSILPSVRYINCDACATLPVASLIATTFSTSLKIFAAVSGRILHPVLPGTLYMMIGNFVHSAISE